MLSVKKFHRPKTGYKESEYEDAFAENPETRAFAVAGGASESSFSGVWAYALVDTFVGNPPRFDQNDRDAIREILKVARGKWYESVNWTSLPWFQKNKAVLGSYSTFLGLQMDFSGEQKRFRCITVGDSCMFHVSGPKMEPFPFADPKDMNYTPRLMWSGHGFPIGPNKEADVQGLEAKYGKLKDGDMIILATDAISKWMLQHKNERPWVPILEKFDKLDSFVGDLIASGQCKNDDVTMIFISLS